MVKNLGQFKKGHIVTEETKRKIGLSNLGEKNPMYGKKASLETRKKQSLASKGKPKSEEHKRNIGLANKSKKHSNVTKKKIGLVHKDKIVSDETKRKLSLAGRGKNLGKKNYFYKGGKMKNYPESIRVRMSPEYKQWRTAVYKRDGFKCQMVGGCPDKNSNKLEANHIKLFSQYPELRLEVSNGITLCKPCHKYIRGREQRYENFFKLIIDNQII